MRNKVLSIFLLLIFLVFSVSISFANTKDDKKRITKIIISGYGKNCDAALEDAINKCKDRKGEVTFVGICSELKDESEDRRWKQDIYCKIEYEIKQ
ncbi:hypothetical protein F1847_07025 [Thermodesulfobacterium sp. TA1]|uniref:hypothetical protein n=1 Tax=Thermodesulfobacterium sp. TA1 TaxID=2234087 RepID=UPI001231F9CE|nr:hypothetical protein [Thermodesulfobacterium sp. TA1]QER42508.1 hypothetical protein F1847_07025 [Thermodesulfobacterium sp. TA1]